ncbi:hypothetical protein Xoosp13_101 [Xanthomonas phage Xoo-sp13]|nr:hypothetical protein Xoosp13_101 [Xanthomonas phage Xoo-sp13]
MTPHTFIDADNNKTIKANQPEPYINVKWPAMLVTGDKVTPEQARDIIFRTNGSYISTNDRDFEAKVMEYLGIPKGEYGYYNGYDKLREKFQSLSLHYLNNDRISSCWVGGFHGWMNWDGTVFSNNYNIGKWPSVEEVLEDWAAIAQAFPYLNLRCQLLNHESSEDIEEPKVTVEYVVKDGTVAMFLPEDVSKLVVSIKPLSDDDILPMFDLNYKDNIGFTRFKSEFEKFKKQNP